MIIPIPSTLIILGVVMIAVSVPMVARMVPMNRWYGVRTRKAFASEDNWYELNAYGGKLMLGYGAFLILAGVVEFRLAVPPTSPWSPLLVGVPVLAVIPVLLLINARGKRLPG
ncbi:MAG TPA: SdpI family protein [Thermoleophilia bacterium]|nr:SdpI family protein [Thermoleophilia bacterium]